MINKQGVAVVTICRDDQFFLERWVAYYGTLFGRSSLYVISHGDTDMVREAAQGCNIFPVPAIETDKFTMLHWRTKNALLSGLRQWYAHVVVCDVDEFIVVDPSSGMNLKTWLDEAPTKTVYTAMGLEIVHLRSKEKDPVTSNILGPRMHAQVALHYAKPCIVSHPSQLGRGGHFSEYNKLNIPDFLYMFHMRYCDFDLFTATMNRRNTFVEAQQALAGEDLRTNPKWFKENRKDLETFKAFEERPIVESFDFNHVRASMQATWKERQNGLWHFQRPEYQELFKLPERFMGVDAGIG